MSDLCELRRISLLRCWMNRPLAGGPDRVKFQGGGGTMRGQREGKMRLLLTSAGIKNGGIHDALVGLLGKPIAEADALCIPTAMYGHPMVGPGPGAWRFISGREPGTPMCE